jgi:hypothetical protein
LIPDPNEVQPIGLQAHGGRLLDYQPAEVFFIEADFFQVLPGFAKDYLDRCDIVRQGFSRAGGCRTVSHKRAVPLLMLLQLPNQLVTQTQFALRDIQQIEPTTEIRKGGNLCCGLFQRDRRGLVLSPALLAGLCRLLESLLATLLLLTSGVSVLKQRQDTRCPIRCINGLTGRFDVGPFRLVAYTFALLGVQFDCPRSGKPGCFPAGAQTGQLGVRPCYDEEFSLLLTLKVGLSLVRDPIKVLFESAFCLRLFASMGVTVLARAFLHPLVDQQA